MSKDLNLAILVDLYRPLLTEKQQETLEMYYDSDLSLGEISEETGITRQGVMNCVKKCEARLMELEEKMGLAKKLETSTEKVMEALNSTQFPISLTCDENDETSTGFDIPVESGEEKLTETMSLNQAINQLEIEDKNLIVLRYYKHKTQSQTAKELGMTQVQVSRREKKILLSIRQKLTV